MTDDQWKARNGRIRASHYIADVCRTIARVAERRELPHSFLAKLIWHESRFDASAVSPKGAQGIAQFMPATAKERGLLNPFSAIQALRAAAHFLSDLRDEFGNVGLAAAAYNAGPQRVKDWLTGKRQLPLGTRAYVLLVTGAPADGWADAKEKEIAEPAGDFTQACIALASSNGIVVPKPRPKASWASNKTKPDLLQRAAAESKPNGGAEARSKAKHAAGARTRPVATIRRSGPTRVHLRAHAVAEFCTRVGSTGAVCRTLRR